MNDFQVISGMFYPEWKFRSCEPYGSGHIHETYLLVKSSGRDIKKIILQRFNNSVFKEPEKVLNNIRKITDHLSRSKKSQGSVNLSLVPTSDQKYWYKDESGKYWRCFDFIEETYTIDRIEDSEQAYEAARFFGNFIFNLADFRPGDLDITIPDFHNLAKRYQWFEDALALGNSERQLAAEEEIRHIKQHSDVVEEFSKNVPGLPLRVTHNDTKINNVLFSNTTRKGICVIDLDTVMPGTVLSDYGDMVRTFTNAGEEDEKDLNKVYFNWDHFKAFTDGFLEGTRHILTPDEIDNLILGGKMIIYMQAMRFLTDYVAGDPYYKIHYPEHNLVRTKNQIRLFDSFLQYEKEARAYIKSKTLK